jgi:hypothetical protein
MEKNICEGGSKSGHYQLPSSRFGTYTIMLNNINDEGGMTNDRFRTRKYSFIPYAASPQSHPAPPQQSG